MVKAVWSNSEDNIYKIIVIEFNEYGIRILSKSKSEFLEITSPKNYTNIQNYHFNQEKLLMINGVISQVNE